MAIPSIISNITVPLLGLVDMAIVGHLGSAAYIGAIAVGGMLFNLIYWLFGFLRMGTSGITSQAYGRRDLREAFLALIRSVGVGLAVGGLLLFLSPVVRWIAFQVIEATPEVAGLASTYFSIGVWGAPAVLALYGFMGWFVGGGCRLGYRDCPIRRISYGDNVGLALLWSPLVSFYLG